MVKKLVKIGQQQQTTVLQQLKWYIFFARTRMVFPRHWYKMSMIPIIKPWVLDNLVTPHGMSCCDREISKKKKLVMHCYLSTQCTSTTFAFLFNQPVFSEDHSRLGQVPDDLPQKIFRGWMPFL